MGPGGSIQVVVWSCLLCSTVLSYTNQNVLIAPQSPVVEIGKNFTATCALTPGTSEASAGDLYWELNKITLPRETYTRVNDSAVSITFTVSRETPTWLFCKCDAKINPISAPWMHGIILTKGYPPETPSGLSCIASQDRDVISPIVTCTWEPGKRGTGELITNYTLLTASDGAKASVAMQNNSGQITFEVFPHFTGVDIWVEADNALGKAESEHLAVDDANHFVKTNPPQDVRLISENNFSTSLLMTWNLPIKKIYVKLKHQIRYCPVASANWTEVPLEDTAKDIQSFRLQFLRPDTRYVCQVRCKHHMEGYGYWSDWSSNTTTRTPEDKPKSPPDVWRIITPGDSGNKRRVEVISKDPVVSNGKIRSFGIRVRGVDWESVAVNRTDSDHGSAEREITVIKELELLDKQSAYIEVIARNAMGESPKATMVITRQAQKLPAVGGLTCSGNGDTLRVEWQPPALTPDPHRYNVTHYVVTHYVVEWVAAGGGQLDWQRELGNATRTNIRGDLEKFKRYNISVYPLYNSGWVGTARTEAAYLEQGVPLEGPSVRLKGKPGSTEAVLEWKAIPEDQRRGFITNYTVFYSTGHGDEKEIMVSADTNSYQLTSLSSNTKYMAWIMASTEQGSVNGTEHSFSTLKYAPGQIEGIVVGVCLGFLFFVVLTMLLCIYKKDTIKKNFWPQIPNPGSSSIGTWSPDFPSKADTPNEDAPTDVSVVKVDTCDGRSLFFDDDKNCLPLKKDKYLSEEHSSGIGGDSSCTSSPRQSVSDSDEGVESAETTASTVQYSSVVAASAATTTTTTTTNGYKGQNPGSFARSESTQPLLDSEENPDTPEATSGQSQRFPPRNPCFLMRATGGPGDGATGEEEEEEERGGSLLLKFCPLEEASPQATPTEGGGESAEARPPASSYAAQLGGYRPQ